MMAATAPREAKPVDAFASADDRSDLDLVAALNRGESEAFEPLYRRHRDWVVDVAFRFTGDRDLALDVLQETFLYLLGKFPGFRLTAQLRTFLYPAVRNLSIAANRKARRLQADEASLAQLEAAPSPAAPADSRGALTAVLARLPEEQREALLLRFVDGLSLAEIAVAMDIPLGTVKSRLHTALTTLRKDPATRGYFNE